MLAKMGMLIALGTTALSYGQVEITRVAISGDTAPGTDGVFRDFSAIRANRTGQIAFQGELTGGEFTGKSYSGIWRYDLTGTNGTLIAREGVAASSGTPANLFGEHVLNDSGSVAMITYLSTGSKLAVLTGDGGTPINRLDGNATLSVNGSTGKWGSLSLGSLDFDAAGNSVHAGSVQVGASFVDCVFAIRNGVVTTHLADNQQAPGQGAGVLISDNGKHPVLARDGALFSNVVLSGTNVTTSNRDAIYRIDSDGTASMVLRSGSTISGLPAGWTVGSITSGSLAAKGSSDITVSVEIKNASAGTTSQAFVRTGPAGARLLALANGNTDGPAWSVASVTEMAGKDMVVSGSTLIEGVAKSAYFVLEGDSGASRLLVRDQQSLPGTLSGVTFDRAGAQFQVGDDGIVLMHARTRPAISSEIQSGLWLANASGDLSFVVRESQLFDVDPGVGVDYRTVADIIDYTLVRPAEPESESFAAFALTFTDGTSGIFTASIPEPAAFGAFVVLGSLALRRAARKNANPDFFRAIS